jgi:soluble lytic murein transglycosylase-like protein
MDRKEIIGISLLALGIGSLIYYFTRRVKEISSGDKQSRLLQFSPSYCMAGLNGINITLPAVESAFYSPDQIPANRSKINQIKSNYGGYVNNISVLTKIPDTLLYAMIFIESTGNPSAHSGKAVGLMQVSPVSATDIVFKEHKTGRLSNQERAIIQQYLGTRASQIYSMRSPGQKQFISENDLYNPELNILIGAILLGQLIDESVEGDTLRLDKVIVRYNSGYYSFSRGKDLVGDTMTVLSRLNPETGAYIRKLLGPNGVLEILEAENCI